MEVREKNAVVIGGGSGIGRGIALALAEAGAHVAVADLEKDAAESVAAEVRARGVRGLGLLRAITLTRDVAPAVAAAAREGGFIVNPVAPAALRLAPPLVVTTAQVDAFVDALPTFLDSASQETP